MRELSIMLITLRFTRRTRFIPHTLFANINEIFDGNTVLVVSTCMGLPSIVELLVSKGAKHLVIQNIGNPHNSRSPFCQAKRYLCVNKVEVAAEHLVTHSRLMND